MKKKVLKTVILCWTGLLFFSCSKNGSDSSYSNNTTTITTNSTSNKISIANMSFVASTTTVTKGTTIIWTNDDNMIHTVTADDNSFTSGNLNKGDTYSHTFNDAATVAYHCKIHPSMTGSVIAK